MKITDFGIAKLLGDNTATHTLTGTGRALGTPHYMAPEQLEHPQDVDPRADIYSLGVVFYEMLTGELPLGRFAPPSAKAPVDPRVDEVVLRTLERERDKRYRSATEVKTRVEAIRESATVAGPARPCAAPDPALQKYHRRHRWRQGAAWGAGLLFLLAGLGVWQGPWREALRRRAAPPGPNPPQGTVVIERIELSPDAAVPGLERLRFRYRADPEHAVVFWLERKVGTNATVDRELSGHVVPPAGQAAEGTVEWTIRTGESMSPQGAGLTRWDFVLRGNSGETRGGYWTNDFANIQGPDFCFGGSVGPIRGFGVLVHRGWMQPLELPQRQLTLGVQVVPIPEDLRNRVAMAPTRGTNLALSLEMIRTTRPQHVLKSQSAENPARPTESKPQPKP